MAVICGVDGCRAGWVVVSKDLDSGAVSWRLCETARDIASQEPVPQVVAIDIPIGLPEAGLRECDREARRLLGSPRGRSVFSAPIRPVLDATSHRQACQIWRRVEDKGMTIQSFSIIPKIKEVDALLRQEPALRETFREVHPEACFYHLNGERPVVPGKRKEDGAAIRRRLLDRHFRKWLSHALADRRRLCCGNDDILDAFAALWTAGRIAMGNATTIPAIPPSDKFGLRMEMVA